MEYYQISILIAVVLIIVEVITTTFITLGFAVGVLAVALIQYLNDDFQFNREIVTFTIVSLFAIIFFRKVFKKKTDQKKLTNDDVNLY